MKAIWKVSLAALVLSGGIGIGSVMNMTANGANVNTQPGTVEDPVVTKSYVDQQIQKALGGTTAPAAPSTGSSTNSGQASSDSQIEVVSVKPGQKLIAKAGAEFIVRNGHAVIYSEDKNGVADLTDGIDITNGQAVTTNHLLSFPRDGRGIQVKDGVTNGLIVMVRGGYEIK